MVIFTLALYHDSMVLNDKGLDLISSEVQLFSCIISWEGYISLLQGAPALVDSQGWTIGCFSWQASC